MQTSGKFYIWLNAATPKSHYWSQPKQCWTTILEEASFFDTEDDAIKELKNPAIQSIGEPMVYRATRNI